MAAVAGYLHRLDCIWGKAFQPRRNRTHGLPAMVALGAARPIGSRSRSSRISRNLTITSWRCRFGNGATVSATSQARLKACSAAVSGVGGGGAMMVMAAVPVGGLKKISFRSTADILSQRTMTPHLHAMWRMSDKSAVTFVVIVVFLTVLLVLWGVVG